MLLRNLTNAAPAPRNICAAARAGRMGLHPRDLPVSRTFDVRDEGEAPAAVDEMVRSGFSGAEGYRVLMPKDGRAARRIGYMVATGVTHGLRRSGQPRDVRYWTYHHDGDHYAMVLVGGGAASALGL